MKTLSSTISSFVSTSFVLIVFLFCLHFCLFSHFEIIGCFVKSLIAISTYFSDEIQLKKGNLKGVFLGTRVGHCSIWRKSSKYHINKCKFSELTSESFNKIRDYVSLGPPEAKLRDCRIVVTLVSSVT